MLSSPYIRLRFWHFVHFWHKGFNAGSKLQLNIFFYTMTKIISVSNAFLIYFLFPTFHFWDHNDFHYLPTFSFYQILAWKLSCPSLSLWPSLRQLLLQYMLRLWAATRCRTADTPESSLWQTCSPITKTLLTIAT